MLCTKCNIDKPESEFFKRINAVKKFRSHCKACCRIGNQNWALANPEAAKEAHRIGQAQWVAANPDKANAITRRAVLKQAHTNPERRLWATARGRAPALELAFNIEISDVTIPTHCQVTGEKIELNQFEKKYIRPDNAPSIDRIIPELGYVKGNVDVLSNRGNRLKNNMTLKDVELILSYFKRGGTRAPVQ